MKRDNQSDDFSTICSRWMTRRQALQGMAAVGVSATGIGSVLAGCDAVDETATSVAPPLTFTEIPHSLDAHHHVPPGYRADVLVAWGDALFADAPAFSANRQSAAAQVRQFGYNNDFIAFLPLPENGYGRPAPDTAPNSRRGLLCVNHEYTSAYLMFPGYTGWKDSAAGLTPEQIAVEMAAHGHSVVEIVKTGDGWQIVSDSPLNRRITMDTPMPLTGAAAGHERVRTTADPDGELVLGTMGNCAGGVTPWGTVLTAEENFRYNFTGYPQALEESHPREATNYARFNFGGHERRHWFRVEDRFHIEREPCEANRFGWMVEFDPYDPASQPRKLTNLGRFQHEGSTVVAADGAPLVTYMGDDGVNEYIYKYVSRANYRSGNGLANSTLFDDGTLYVARFHDDGSGEWLPLVHGTGPLTAANGFRDQGEVMIDTRLAADLLGATPMDRPEDIETNPVTGRTYAMLTKNPDRVDTHPSNPRRHNEWGHIVEILSPGEDGARDHSATTFTWDIFILAGDPNAEETGGSHYGEGTSPSGWFCNPDNIAFDPTGRIWMATDNGSNFDFHDGLWAAQTTGSERAVSRHFFGCPRGAECCGPCFTPDGRTLFVAVQHPADEDGSSFDTPSTRWPDFRDDEPPRPAVVAITRDDGDIIGS